jgi:hypothetical protein
MNRRPHRGPRPDPIPPPQRGMKPGPSPQRRSSDTTADTTDATTNFSGNHQLRPAPPPRRQNGSIARPIPAPPYADDRPTQSPKIKRQTVPAALSRIQDRARGIRSKGTSSP